MHLQYTCIEAQTKVLCKDSFSAYEFLTNFSAEVFVSADEEMTDENVCGEYRGTLSPGAAYSFSCNDKLARYVRIQKSDSDIKRNLMILCEVEVYGTLWDGSEPVARSTDTSPLPSE